MCIYEIVENDPDLLIRFGDIDDAGDRVAWIAARGIEAAVEFAKSKGITVDSSRVIDLTYPDYGIEDGVDAVIANKIVIERAQEAINEKI